jgi:hypothetical protein
MLCDGDRFTYLYVDDVSTSQETQVSTACYRDSFNFYMQIMFVPHKKQVSTACYSDSFTFLYVDYVRTS